MATSCRKCWLGSSVGNSDICYNKIPRSEIEHQEREKSTEKWQQQWDHTTKGLATKEFFLNIKDRLKMKINLSPKFTAMLTAHGKTRLYLHRLKIIESPECPYANGNQTVDHLMYQCSKLNNKREKTNSVYLKKKDDNWTVKKNELVNKYLKQFKIFTNSIDYGKM